MSQGVHICEMINKLNSSCCHQSFKVLKSQAYKRLCKEHFVSLTPAEKGTSLLVGGRNGRRNMLPCIKQGWGIEEAKFLFLQCTLFSLHKVPTRQTSWVYDLCSHMGSHTCLNTVVIRNLEILNSFLTQDVTSSFCTGSCKICCQFWVLSTYHSK